ncbi:MAG: glycosyltransferase, partial [Chloroflexi bacterium]
MDLSIIVPVFNEQDSLKLLYAAVVQAVDPLGCSWELVLVDDGSKDKSVAV